VTRITVTFHEDRYTFLIICRSFLLFQAKIVEEITIKFLYSITIFFESRAVCALVWKNIVEPGRPQITWRMRIAYERIHSEYV